MQNGEIDGWKNSVSYAKDNVIFIDGEIMITGDFEVTHFTIDGYDADEYFYRIESLVHFCNTGKFLDEI